MIKKISPNSEALIAQAADDFSNLATELMETKQQIRILLTGGTLGIEFIRAMGKLNLDWSRIWLMFSDERFVSFGHPDRNEDQGIAVWPELAKHLNRFPDASMSLADAKQIAQEHLQATLADGEGFDLTILGMGPDGHVASLFPGHNQPGDLVIAEPDSPKPPSQRLSLSYKALAQSKRVWFIASGEPKAWAVAAALAGESVPAGRVRGELETVWYLDRALSDAL